MSVYINNNQPGLSAKVKPGIVSILRLPYLSKKSLLVLHLKFGRAVLVVGVLSKKTLNYGRNFSRFLLPILLPLDNGF